MLTYVVRRLLMMIPTMLGITMVVFFIMKAAPGDPAQMLISADAEMRPDERRELVEYTRKRYHLDKPVVAQYLLWLNKVSPVGFTVDDDGRMQQLTVKGPDFGESFRVRRPVADLVFEALPITLLLNLVSLPIVFGIAIVTGMGAARFRGQAFDTISGIVFLAMWSFPSMLAGVLLINLFANDNYLKWFPFGGLGETTGHDMTFLPVATTDGWSEGYLLHVLWHLVLPVICLSYGGFAVLSKLTRASVLDALSADYVRTARAKGVSGIDALFRHAFRNSLLPLITVASGILPSLLAGSVIVETIFNIDGMGKLMVTAVKFKDQELVMAVTLVAGMLGLISYLIADLGYAIADPRVSYD